MTVTGTDCVAGDWNALHQAVFADADTTDEEWGRIADRCSEVGYDTVALEILATVLVQSVTAKAVIMASRQHSLRTVRGNITPPLATAHKSRDDN